MAMGKCSAYSSLQADSKVKFAPLPTSCGHLALTYFRPEEPKWTLAYGFCAVDDSTINIVVVIVIIIIIIIIIYTAVTAHINKLRKMDHLKDQRL